MRRPSFGRPFADSRGGAVRVGSAVPFVLADGTKGR